MLKKLHPSLFSKDRCLYILGFTFYVFPSLSTAVNPIILFKFGTNYNRALKNLFSALCKCESEKRKPKQQSVVESVATQTLNVEMAVINRKS